MTFKDSPSEILPFESWNKINSTNQNQVKDFLKSVFFLITDSGGDHNTTYVSDQASVGPSKLDSNIHQSRIGFCLCNVNFSHAMLD